MDRLGLARELRAALDALIRERDELDEEIAVLEETLCQLGVTGTKRAKKKVIWTPAMRKAAAERATARFAKAKEVQRALEPRAKNTRAAPRQKTREIAASKETTEQKKSGHMLAPRRKRVLTTRVPRRFRRRD